MSCDSKYPGVELRSSSIWFTTGAATLEGWGFASGFRGTGDTKSSASTRGKFVMNFQDTSGCGSFHVGDVIFGTGSARVVLT
jgi:hypothetical protein